MYTKAAFLKSIALEAKIIKHLVTQIPTGQADWRLTPPQRSTIELIRFLSFMPFASVEFALTQGWDKWEGHEAGAKDLQPADFPKAMDKQIKGITKLLAKHGDAALKRKTTKHWNGTKMTLGEALVGDGAEHHGRLPHAVVPAGEGQRRGASDLQRLLDGQGGQGESCQGLNGTADRATTAPHSLSG